MVFDIHQCMFVHVQHYYRVYRRVPTIIYVQGRPTFKSFWTVVPTRSPPTTTSVHGFGTNSMRGVPHFLTAQHKRETLLEAMCTGLVIRTTTRIGSFISSSHPRPAYLLWDARRKQMTAMGSSVGEFCGVVLWGVCWRVKN